MGDVKRRAGVVLSSASSTVGDLVTPCDDPGSFIVKLRSAQPGIRAVPVWDEGDGHGFRTANGFTPEQIISRWEREGMSMWDELDKAADDLMSLSIEPPKRPTLRLVEPESVDGHEADRG
jgi:hypothetical protein